MYVSRYNITRASCLYICTSPAAKHRCTMSSLAKQVQTGKELSILLCSRQCPTFGTNVKLVLVMRYIIFVNWKSVLSESDN